jgi:glycosyltransferase involved in cell wall biosynthesis
MNFSVVIPTFNSAQFIRHTIEAAASQSYPASEILVLDDGSTDKTLDLLSNCRAPCKILTQANRGVAAARNALVALAKGDVVAFLDHDDLWHPQYLETQHAILAGEPDIEVSFTGHHDLAGYGCYEWNDAVEFSASKLQRLDALEFYEAYNARTGPFGSMSYCCVTMRSLKTLGGEPFRLSGVDDSYFLSRAALLGCKFSYYDEPLVAYRITAAGQSHDKVKALRLWTEAFSQLEPEFVETSTSPLLAAFRRAYAGKERALARLLMGRGDVEAARQAVTGSLRRCRASLSIAKSLTLLALTYCPRAVQPRWPSDRRL